ncbi:hypothetical protein [Propylenella binzhouense]|uniref:Uncharacterized protein n=1 Tax=Propylenella binzhouense TaxID=2555902 RepID=A0A964WTT8_9HYPH|nr:hypothetical protein [Propylenella binzhouense]MYZ48155.1 hypothetical protein [Propylenella binzhouense]
MRSARLASAAILGFVAMAVHAQASGEPVRSAETRPTWLAQAGTQMPAIAPGGPGEEAPGAEPPAAPEGPEGMPQEPGAEPDNPDAAQGPMEAPPPEGGPSESGPSDEGAPAPGEVPESAEPTPGPGAPEPSAPGEGKILTQPPPGPDSALPSILRSPDDMPEPVRKTWADIMAAARSGDIERLRPLIRRQADPPLFALDAELDDPVEYLKSLSGDPEGREILAILLEVLEAGFVHVDQGTADDMYVWPYFAQYPIDALSPEQMVEMYTLLTSADYQEMRSYGAYIFFRVGISPDGRWRFFVAGD